VTEIRALFWDIGGVLLTNGWDRRSRRAAAERFGLDWEEFQDRHELINADFETGRLSLDDYLKRTIFYRPREFSPDEVKEFMFAQSQPHAEVRAVAEALARSGRYLMATLNNESLELNEFRIERFGLRNLFSIFFSSCYLGVHKPDETIYRMALQITQRPPYECLFIDDRELNLECAAQLGMNVLHYEDPASLCDQLAEYGIDHG
jgi:putative hydrolase of the HAD superfamily